MRARRAGPRATNAARAMGALEGAAVADDRGDGYRTAGRDARPRVAAHRRQSALMTSAQARAEQHEQAARAAPPEQDAVEWGRAAMEWLTTPEFARAGACWAHQADDRGAARPPAHGRSRCEWTRHLLRRIPSRVAARSPFRPCGPNVGTLAPLLAAPNAQPSDPQPTPTGHTGRSCASGPDPGNSRDTLARVPRRRATLLTSGASPWHQ